MHPPYTSCTTHATDHNAAKLVDVHRRSGMHAGLPTDNVYPGRHAPHSGPNRCGAQLDAMVSHGMVAPSQQYPAGQRAKRATTAGVWGTDGGSVDNAAATCDDDDVTTAVPQNDGSGFTAPKLSQTAPDGHGRQGTGRPPSREPSEPLAVKAYVPGAHHRQPNCKSDVLNWHSVDTSEQLSSTTVDT